MSIDSFVCRSCGKANPASVSVCIHCGCSLARVPQRRCSRRAALLGLTGVVGALAVGGGAEIWYASSRRPQLLTYTGHRGAPITTLTWSPDGKTIASGDAGGTVLVWDTFSGATVLTCREAATQGVASLAWSPDGASILAGYLNRLVIWDARSARSTLSTAQLTGPAAYSSEGGYRECYLIYHTLLAACQRQQAVHVFPATSLKTPLTSFETAAAQTLAFEPGAGHFDLALVTPSPSQQLVIYGGTPSSTCARDGRPNALLSYEKVDMSAPAAGALAFPWGPGGGYLLAGSLPGDVMIGGSWGRYEMEHPTNVVAAALCPARASLPADAHPDGWYTVIGYIATADTEGIVRIWGNDGRYIVALQNRQPVLQLAWSPDGSALAAVRSDGTVQLWQAQLSNLPALWRNTSFN